nr:gag pol polyprotein [Hymenolepis microstoma]
MNRFSAPPETRLEQVYLTTQLGDRSPSQLSSPFQDELDKLVEVADRVHSHYGGHSVNAVGLDALTEQFQKMQLLLSGSSSCSDRQRSILPRRRRSSARPDGTMKENIQPIGEILSQAVKATTDPGYFPSRLLQVVERNSKLRFLVDSGSEVSVIPRSAEKRCLQASELSLLVANNTKIRTYGHKLLNLDLGLRREFPFVFLIADVRKPIRGADFISKVRLLVNLRDRTLNDGVTSLQTETSEPKHKKKNGDWRPCDDYWALNGITAPDRYPIPHVHVFPLHIHGKVMFSKLDLVRAYHRFPMASEDTARTVVITPFGLFEYLRMPFGLRNAAQSFQRFMDQDFRGLDFVFTYFDDVLIASSNLEEHKQHLQQVFERLQQYGITVNSEKCKVVHTPAPLTDLPNGNRKPFIMTSEAETAFSEVKQELSKATTLNHLDTSSQTCLVLKTDASQLAVGAVLQQVVEGETQPLSFFSKKLTTTETETRHLDFIAQLTNDIRHIDGTSNVVADAMSRLEMNQVVVPFLDLQFLASEQWSDPDFTEIIFNPSLRFECLPLPDSSTEIHCAVSTDNPKPFVPQTYRLKIFDHNHGLSHLNIRATTKLITDRFVWKNIRQDVPRFRHIHVDIIGALPPSNSFSYILTCIDRFMRWPIAVPSHNTSSPSVSKALIDSWICIFGVPSVITTDRGPQFTFTLFRELNQLLGSTHIRTTANHPEANGLVERFHRQLKSAIIATYSGLNWMERLPIILLAFRSTVKGNLGCCPAELVLGTPLRLPGEMTCESHYRVSVDPSWYATRLKEHFRSLLPTPTRQDSKSTYIHKDLSTSVFGYVRADAVKKPLQPPYEGTYKVLQRNSKYFILDRNSTKDSVSSDELKPAYLDYQFDIFKFPFFGSAFFSKNERIVTGGWCLAVPYDRSLT